MFIPIVILVLVLLHYLYEYLLTMLTVPKINEVAKKRAQKYKEIQEIL